MKNNCAQQETFSSSLASRVIQLSLPALMIFCLFYPALSHSHGSQSGAKVRRLSFIVRTGGDDLRGGNDNLNVVVNFRDGTKQLMPNVNKGQRWADNTTQTFNISLRWPVPVTEIASLEFRTTFGGGSGGDNWDMDSVTVKAVGEGVSDVIFRHGSKRFTHDDGFLTLRGQH